MTASRRRAQAGWPFVGKILGLLLCWQPAFSLGTDPSQPTEIQSDYAELDDRAHKAIYTGKVEVVQGTLHMWGDKLTIYYTEGNELKEGYMVGRPARFKQQPENGEEVHGESTQFEFFAQKNLMHLIENAKVIQGERLFSGHFLSYDTEKGIITGRKSNPDELNPAGNAPAGNQRIRVVLPPKKDPPAAGASTSTTSKGVPPPRASTAPAPRGKEASSPRDPDPLGRDRDLPLPRDEGAARLKGRDVPMPRDPLPALPKEEGRGKPLSRTMDGSPPPFIMH